MISKFVKISLISFLFVVSSVSAVSLSDYSLMPVPKSIEFGKGKFRLTSEFKIGLTGFKGERLNQAATRMLRRLDGRTGLFFEQDFITAGSVGIEARMQISVEKVGELQLHENESYQLSISQEAIRLSAPTDFGAMHGMETLLQLISVDSEGYYFPVAEISDQPRFPWRGLMIDISRHFMPADVIKRNLDAMSAMKMNVFHWHLADDQGFRVECKTFPNLHLLGSDGFYYTQDQIRDIIRYASDRGIRVIPEFDVPAHATSWIYAYPELGSGVLPESVERGWGIKDQTLNPIKESTYKFLDKFFEEMATLFPDEYLHIGGDENNGKHWDGNEEIQQFMKENDIADNHALQTYFNKRILQILTRHNKKMIGWDEIFQPELPKNVVIHSWRGQESLVKSAQQGYWGILSNGYYIDLIQPAEFHYLNDPVPHDSPLNKKEKEFILGGEATSWAELVTPETIDSRIWPRTAAIAERFWSPASIRDVEDMYRRLDLVSMQLEELGLLHIKNYDMMLRRLCNYGDISALKTFTNVVEPVKIYTRHRQGVKYWQHSPYSRTVDAARPESMTARKFNQTIARFIDEKEEAVAEQLNQMLTGWQQNHEKLLVTAANSPVIKEILPLSENLAQISAKTMDAIKYFQRGIEPDKKWKKEMETFLEESKKPYGQVELMIVSGIEELYKKL